MALVKVARALIARIHAEARRAKTAREEVLARGIVEARRPIQTSVIGREIEKVNVTDGFVKKLAQMKLADNRIAVPNVQTTERIGG